MQWSNADNRNIYRLGHRGKVDLKCKEVGEGYDYYVDHLPVLGEGRGGEGRGEEWSGGEGRGGRVRKRGEGKGGEGRGEEWSGGEGRGGRVRKRGEGKGGDEQ